MNAQSSLTPGKTALSMLTGATLLAASGFLAVSGVIIADPCPPSGKEQAFAARPLSAGSANSSPVHVRHVRDISTFQACIQPASSGRVVTNPQACELMNTLVHEFSKQVAAVDQSLTKEVGVGLSDIFTAIQSQMAIAVIGVETPEFERACQEPVPVIVNDFIAAGVIFAVDARQHLVSARNRFASFLTRAQAADGQAQVNEFEMDGHAVCSISQGGRQIFLTWLGPVLIGSVGPEAMNAAIVHYEAAEKDKPQGVI